MTTLEMITALRAEGYRVTKPRAPKAKATVPALNAIGKPYGANFDPNWKRRNALTTIARLYKPMPRDTRYVH